MTIDMHCHWIPDRLAAALRGRKEAPRLVRRNGQERLVVYRETLPFDAAYTDIDARLRAMDRLGVKRHVLSCPGLFGIDSLPSDEAVPLVEMFNDAVAGLVAAYPDRFSGLASLPIADPDRAVAEFERARTRLGLIGAILPANAFVTLEQANRLRPLFDRGQALGAHFFVHPGPRPDEIAAGGSEAHKVRDNEGQRHITLDVQAILSHVAVTLLFTDFLDPYPAVSVQIANLGGALPFLIERMDHVSAMRTPDHAPPSSTTGRIHVDCSSFGPRAIALAGHLFGWDRVMLGTDHPIFDTKRTLAAVAAAAPDQASRGAVLHRNAARLLDALG